MPIETNIVKVLEWAYENDELEEGVQNKLLEAQPTFEMKGFRKGKVPMSLLKKQFGERVMGEVMQEAVVMRHDAPASIQ